MYVCQLLYGRPSEHSLMSISFHTDINHNLSGRPSEHSWAARNPVDEHPSDHLRTFVSFYTDVHQKIHRRPSALGNKTLKDVHLLSCGRPSVFIWRKS